MKDINQVARDLSKLIKGRVLDAGDSEYQRAVRIDNGRISLEPGLLVVPTDEQDVSEVVKYVAAKRASQEEITLTTRCGGHGASGYCLNQGGIVLDIRALNRRSFDRNSKVLTIGMGNIWRDVYDYMENTETGFIPIGGGCPGVGVAGFLLGSGFSFVSRSYGLGSDNIRSLRVVKADGTIADVDAKNDAELFWALRGGGGGNFAIAVEAQLQTQPPRAESMMMGQIFFPLYRVAEVLEFYNEWVEREDFPRELAVYGYLGHQPDPRHFGRPLLTLRFTPVFNGRFSEGVEHLKPLIELDPIRAEFFEMTLPEFEDFIGAGTQVEGRSAYIRSIIAAPGSFGSTNQKASDNDVARVFMEHMTRAPSQNTFVVWTHLGGAVEHDFGEDDGAFAHRSARFVPEVKAIWDSSKPHEMRRNVEWAYDFFEDLAAASKSDAAYLNYIDPLLVDWKSKYYGGYASRLQKVKKAVDPDGLFDFQQGVDSPFNPAGKATKDDWLDLSPLGRTIV